MFTFSHFLHLLFLNCFGIFLQFTFIPNAKIIPGILLSFRNCTAVWIIGDHGLQMSLRCVHAFPRFHLEDFSLSASSRVPSGLVRIKLRMGRLGLRLLFIHFTQIAKVWLIQNPAWFTVVAIPFLPTLSWALSTILCARFVSLKNRVLKSPLPPPHSNFRHIGFEIHTVYCESLFLIWGLQVTQLFITASHLRDKWMHCSSADLSGGNIWSVGGTSTMQGRETWGDCTGHLSQRPRFADSPRHKCRWIFSSNYILAQWLQILVWQTFARAKHCTWNAKKREGEMLCLCGRATICRHDWRWKITGQTNNCQTISVQVESNGSGALCWTLTGLTVSPSSPSNMCLLPSIAAPQLPRLDAASLWVTHRPDHPGQRKGKAAALFCLRNVLHKRELFPKQPHPQEHPVCTHCSLQRVNASPWLNWMGPKDMSEVCACLYYNWLSFLFT